MIRFVIPALRRVLLPLVGAAAFSSACVLGAVAPAMAAEPATVAAWQGMVEDRLDAATADGSERFTPFLWRQADLALRFDADGGFAGAEIARGTGSRILDARALALATHTSYPRLPAAMRGRPQRVTMRLVFGGSRGSIKDRPVEVARAAASAAAVEVAAR